MLIAIAAWGGSQLPQTRPCYDSYRGVLASTEATYMGRVRPIGQAARKRPESGAFRPLGEKWMRSKDTTACSATGNCMVSGTSVPSRGLDAVIRCRALSVFIGVLLHCVVAHPADRAGPRNVPRQRNGGLLFELCSFTLVP